jgi:hypothetical protein
MRISQWTGTLGAAAAIALLAGCSGGSQYAPSATGGTGTTGTTSLSRHGVNAAMPFASKVANDAFLHRSISRVGVGQVIINKKAKCKAKKRGLTFASSNVTLDLLVYCGAKGNGHITSGQAAYKTITGVAGWGIAVHGNLLAVGTEGGTVTTYTLPGITNPHTLTLSHGVSGYNAYGLAFDSAGGLYATNWPGGYLDYFKTPSATSPTPTCSTATAVNTEAYYVSAHGSNSAVVYGINTNTSLDDVDTEGLTNLSNGCSGITDAKIETFGQLAEGTGFPGGVVSNSTGELFVNNQYGTLYDDGAYPGGSVSSSCTWGFDPNDITNINMASNQASIWGSNINFAATLETYLESFKSSIGSGSCATGAVGGPTQQLSNDEFLGVASWPNAGN